MAPSAQVPPETIAQQFENACFPFWVVNLELDIIYFNKRAATLHPGSRLPDGLRILFPPQDCKEIIGMIAEGKSFNSIPSAILGAPATALSFSPYPQGGRYAGAYVMLVQVDEASTQGTDLRQSLLSSSSLVITQGFSKCASDILYSLSACANKLHTAKLDLVDDQLRVINHNCYQILRSTENLSERIKYAADIPPIVQCVDFWDSCAELFEACSTVLRARQFDFIYELPESTVYVSCDFEKITVALLQIISNAYLYGGSGVRLQITGRDAAEGVLLTLSDNGPGIPSEMQHRVFQPFCSWDCLERQNAGTGLGLNIVRNIVSQAKGKLALNSDPDGTTIVLSLPTTEAPEMAPQLSSTSASYMQDRFSLLYVMLCDVIPPPEP